MRRHSPARPLAFVYIARDEVTGLFKVGFSIDPLRRVAQLSATEKHPVTLLAASEGSPNDRATLEHAIHRALSETQVHGEWFRPSPFLERCIAACGSTLPNALPETTDEAILVRLTAIDEDWATLPSERGGPQDPRLALVDAAALRAQRNRPVRPRFTYARSIWSYDAAAYWHEWAGLL